MISHFNSQSSSITELTIAPFMSAAAPPNSDSKPAEQLKKTQSIFLPPKHPRRIVSQKTGSAKCYENSLLSTSGSRLNFFAPQTILDQFTPSSKRRKFDETLESSDEILSVPKADSLSLMTTASDDGNGIVKAKVVENENTVKKLTLNVFDIFEKIRLFKQRQVEEEKGGALKLLAAELMLKQKNNFEKAGYRLHKKLGRGAFGTVYKVSSIIKQNPNIFYAAKINQKFKKKPITQKLYADDQRNESDILKSLTAVDRIGRKHIVSMIEGLEIDTNVHCIIMELMKSNLREFANQKGYSFNITELKQMTLQLVDNLVFLSTQGIIHADLKPENILLKSKDDLRIADFGHSFSLDRNYRFVQSLFYRAPEVSARYQTLTPKIDIWSLGCILFEMFTGEVLFQSTTEDNNAIEDCSNLLCQTRILGQNTHASKGTLFHHPEQSQIFLDYARKTFALITAPGNSSFDKHIMNTKGRALDQEELSLADLIKKMLDFNPESRISAEEALIHPFILGHAASCSEISVANASIEETAAATSSFSSSESAIDSCSESNFDSSSES